MFSVRSPQPLGAAPSFGFGDRLGLATLGHLDAVRSYAGPIWPIFAQQSIREMTRTGRKPAAVLADAKAGLAAGSYTGPWGADADHLKTEDEINAVAGAGFVTFTLDPTDWLDWRGETLTQSELDRAFRDDHDDLGWAEAYFDRVLSLGDGVTLTAHRTHVQRLAVKWSAALAQAVKLAAHVDRVLVRKGAAYEIELCLDETPTATSPLEHFLLAEQCLQAQVKLVAVAPHLDGLEPAIDFGGDRALFEARLREHAAVARALGGHKLSLHSGSDKFSLYENLARVTGGRFHVKTAGTSYLEALRVAARCERKLFRRIVDLSRLRFASDRASYSLSAVPDRLPPAAAVSSDAVLEQIYLDQPNGRQLLAVTFGSIFTEPTLGPLLRDVLAAHPQTHRELLSAHLGRHLQALTRGLERVQTRGGQVA